MNWKECALIKYANLMVFIKNLIFNYCLGIETSVDNFKIWSRVGSCNTYFLSEWVLRFCVYIFHYVSLPIFGFQIALHGRDMQLLSQNVQLNYLNIILLGHFYSFSVDNMSFFHIQLNRLKCPYGWRQQLLINYVQ